MGDLKYSLMWDAYNKSMCKGLSLLQQRGEFVDMTLAADGHHVKVHKMVMSLVSPYIKDLISSADCPHPVIFLNQISYETLTSILEYIYTGQVLVDKDNLTKFMEACKALHIRGFEELEITHKNSMEIKNEQDENKIIVNKGDLNVHDYSLHVECNDQVDDADTDVQTNYLHVEADDQVMEQVVIKEPVSHAKKPSVQYSLSNHGNLQLVLNRYVYNLRYSARKSGQHTWQCVDGHCKGKKCPARVVTHRDTVLGRSNPHNHPHHDKKILKKIQTGTIFTALHEAENQMQLVRREKDKANEAVN